VVKASADGIVLDGLLIDANYSTAGLQVSGGDVTGVGLVVQEGFGDVGGGVEVRSEGRFVCTDCRFEHNLAAQGGGIHSSGTLQLFDSSLCANESFGEGGGLFAKGATLIRRTAVVRNIASGPGGGAFVEEHRGTQLHNMVFLENVLRTNGGGEALHVAGAADVRNAIFVQHENEVALDNRDGDTPVATTSTPTTGWATSPPPTRKTSWTATSPSGTRASTATSTSAWSACPR
jgi:predicted outer membrane repeat protein